MAKHNGHLSLIKKINSLKNPATKKKGTTWWCAPNKDLVSVFICLLMHMKVVNLLKCDPDMLCTFVAPRTSSRCSRKQVNRTWGTSWGWVSRWWGGRSNVHWTIHPWSHSATSCSCRDWLQKGTVLRMAYWVWVWWWGTAYHSTSWSVCSNFRMRLSL